MTAREIMPAALEGEPRWAENLDKPSYVDRVELLPRLREHSYVDRVELVPRLLRGNVPATVPVGIEELTNPPTSIESNCPLASSGVMSPPPSASRNWNMPLKTRGEKRSRK